MSTVAIVFNAFYAREGGKVLARFFGIGRLSETRRAVPIDWRGPILVFAGIRVHTV